MSIEGPKTNDSEELPDYNLMELDLVKYVSTEGLSVGDIQTAYFIAMGVQSEYVPARVAALVDKLIPMFKQGYSPTRALVLLEAMDTVETERNIYKCMNLIDSLPITNKENLLLRSIIEKKREGKLEIFRRSDSLRIHGINMGFGPRIDVKDVANLLYNYIQFLIVKFNTNEFEFYFEEK